MIKKEQDAIDNLDNLLENLNKNKQNLNLLNELNDLKARLVQLEILVSNLSISKTPVYSGGSGGGLINGRYVFTTSTGTNWNGKSTQTYPSINPTY